MALTIVLKVDPRKIDIEAIDLAASYIRRGRLVAFPTETVYGLGCNALSSDAARRVYEAKGRPPDNPLIVHISDFDMLYLVAREVPEKALKLAKRLWPGPLTLVLPKSDRVPPEVTAGLETVAVRMPAHPVAMALIERAGTPIAAPSANPSGRPSPTKAEHVLRDLSFKADIVIDGGETIYGLESTILNLLGSVPVLLRPGAYPVEVLEELLGEKIHVPEFAKGFGDAPRALAPGMKHRHYAPSTPLVLFECSEYDGPHSPCLEKLVNAILAFLKDVSGRPCIVASEETAKAYRDVGARVLVIGSRANLYEVAKRLFEVLRKLDEIGCDVALMEGYPDRGLGLAIMNRARKASVRRVVVS
ncbi:MAG: L-threonylcarbamoyladenylate synthase [Desulfurococcaceae archaeon]